MLAARLAQASGATIYLLSDEPYRKLVYDGVRGARASSPLYPHSIVVTSYSKDLSLPGERIGYVAVNPAADDAARLVDGIILCTRILGYVNAPALMQRVVGRLQGVSVDVEIYRKKRDLLCDALAGMGYELRGPAGRVLPLPESPWRRRSRLRPGPAGRAACSWCPGRGFGFPG